MAPKRKTAQGNNVSHTAMKGRGSKRLGNIITNEETTTDFMGSSEKKQAKKKINKTKSSLNKTNQTNSEIIIENNSVEQNTNLMIIDSFHDTDSHETTSTSMDESHIALNDDTQLKPSTRHSINMDDDDDDNDEFCRMFMSKTPTFNNNHSHNSTPLGVSRKHNENVHSTTDSSSSRYVKNTALGRSSNLINDYHSKGGSDSHIKNINTPTNSRIDALRQSQTCSSIRSLSSVSTASNNIVILETFVEYRNLKRDYERASKQNDVWARDYETLTRRMRRLEETTFPRPSADGYAFIEQLLHSLRASQSDQDSRTNAELARDLGLSEATLMSSSNIDPQKTSLRLFNTLFQGNQEKEALINVAHLSVEYPNLLNDILVFARRCSPGCGYTDTMLKDAIGNSIRCARHSMKKANTHQIAAVAVTQTQMHHGIGHIEDI